ncbi:hypothetical protein BCE75_101382 [Isoptericola sp. CG 20/1183]|uniref:Uncharacterized protein n=1 Tax=Isoptericola halotolerans TaxID=300560 RepID=A0ABX5EHB7_9MICO|nr:MULTISPECIES: hypothetical protein [Isoptericola]MCK0117275.1 hypothetical protein [Isoptericola sp. S6320L]PRZ08498.1 hypothetical protein BCL65_10240 [Isoptericola halotolerans]PRZ11055.1 hypothetical protein BCE75_101382 [Isoptericola sp. CG 20/1183]
MTLEKMLDRWDVVGRLTFVMAMCFCAEMFWVVVQMFVALAMGDNFGSLGLLATAFRWLSWVPASIYAAAIFLSIRLPRVRRDTSWSADGHLRIPPIGRGMLLFFGVLLFFSTGAHAGSLLPEDSPPPTAGYVVTVMLCLNGILLTRIVLGTFRLLPRSWRVAPASAPAPGDGIEVPEQRLAPPRTTREPPAP